MREVPSIQRLAPRMRSERGMKPITIIGILLIIGGVFLLVSEGITYTDTEKVIDIGPIEATAEREKTIPISPIVGGAILAAGVILVVTGRKP